MSTISSEDPVLVTTCQQFLTDALAKRKREEDPEVAYLYGTVSDAFPGLIKIGQTTNVNTSCAHRLVAVVPTYEPVRDEKVAHAFFDEFREEGEFFRVEVEALERFFCKYIL